jgi:hypothetical protein
VSFDELNTRALDAAIARHLLGCEVEARRNARTGELDYVCRRAGQEWQRVPFFSSANAIMALVVEFKLSDFGWRLTPGSEARRQATGLVRVVLERRRASGGHRRDVRGRIVRSGFASGRAKRRSVAARS